MGTQGSKGLSREVEAKKMTQKQVTFEFQPCHERWIANENFLNELLAENIKFTANLLKFFPNARKDYDEFVQMAFFLRKLQIKPVKSSFAKEAAPKASLVDRFFMISLGISKWQQYQKVTMQSDELEDVFIELMKIFIASPKKGFIKKLRKFLSIQNPQKLSLKQFASAIRKGLTQTTKHLRDYTTLKFRDMAKDGHLLQEFKSGILREDAVILSMKIPQLTGKEIKLLYDSQTCGLSFHSYEKRIIAYEGPWLLLIETTDKQPYKFGSFQSGPVRDIIEYQGDLRGFMFSIEPNIRFMTTDKGEDGSHYFFINTIDEKVSKRRRGLGFGGDFAKGNCKLWIDQDLDKSTVYNGNDPTYGYGSLANPQSTTLSIKKMQIWGLGTKFDLEKQAAYWQQRQQQAMRRRKVNKKDLIDGNAGLIFEKTFAHRDQVYGEIQKKEKKQEEK